MVFDSISAFSLSSQKPKTDSNKLSSCLTKHVLEMWLTANRIN